MERLAISLDREMDVMCRWGLNAEEWMILRLLFIARAPENRPQYLNRYLSECSKTSVTRDLILSLQKKKVIDAGYKVPKLGEVFTVDDLEFNPTFEKQYFKISAEAGKEMFDAYPSHIYMKDGKMLSARNITKGGYMDFDQIFFAYSKAIKHDPSTHKLVMESLEFAKDNDLIQYGIIEYIASQKWHEHISMMKDDKVGKFSTRLDNISLV